MKKNIKRMLIVASLSMTNLFGQSPTENYALELNEIINDRTLNDKNFLKARAQTLLENFNQQNEASKKIRNEFQIESYTNLESLPEAKNQIEAVKSDFSQNINEYAKLLNEYRDLKKEEENFNRQ